MVNGKFFQSLASVLKAVAIGDRVKVTVRPESGSFLNPMEGEIADKDERGNLSLKVEQAVLRISAEDVLSVTRLQR